MLMSRKLPEVDLSVLLIVDDVLKKVLFPNSSSCSREQWILCTCLRFVFYRVEMFSSGLNKGWCRWSRWMTRQLLEQTCFSLREQRFVRCLFFFNLPVGPMQFGFPPPAAESGCLHRWLFEILHTARVASCVSPGCRPHNNKKNVFFLCSNTFRWKKILLFSGALQPSRTGINLVT